MRFADVGQRFNSNSTFLFPNSLRGITLLYFYKPSFRSDEAVFFGLKGVVIKVWNSGNMEAGNRRGEVKFKYSHH